MAQPSQSDTLLAAILASIPLVSVLAMMRINHEGASNDEIINFSKNIWLILPSLLLFIVMLELIQRG